MEIEIVRDSDGLESLGSEWEELQARDTHVPFYSTFAVVRAWWAAYGRDDGHELLVVTARHNGDLVGVAPLSYRPQTRYGVPIKEVRFASHGDYLAFLLEPELPAGTVTQALMDAVLGQSDWDILNLTNIPASTPFSAALLRSEHHTRLTPLSENPYLDLREYPDFEAFTADRLPSHTRKYRNRLLRDKGARFRVVEGDAEGVLDRMAELHRAERDFLRARGRTERHSLWDDERRVEHYRRIYAEPGTGLTFLLEGADGTLLGYRTCFVHGRTLLSWNSAYHPDVADYRMGKVIQYDILEHLYARGDVDRFDLGAGRYPWKYEWTDRSTLSYRFRHDRPALTAAAPPVRLRSGPPPPVDAQVRADRVREDRERSAAVELERQERDLRRGRQARGPRHAARTLAVGAARAVLHRARPPVVYYVPHPDDEAIYMGASIWSERNRRTVVVSLTSGGASRVLPWINERLGQQVTREGLERSRVADLRRSVHHLGVAPADVHVKDLPDGQLSVELVRTVVEEMARLHPGASHRTMSYLDPHPDHAAAGEAVRQAHAEGVVEDCLFHVPVDLVDESLGSPVPLSTAACDAKRAALAEYRVWDPFAERYAVGLLSVPDLIAAQTVEPRERVHGPEVDPPADGTGPV
ncbi:GNAT family N-acetyltransferase [Ornithinimicrobium flavum]|uniref:GNAT family N-acetyltransferase n=1 Tax=Ornithinimicrobium flavum TaxID=1288636 RepID=UPI001070001A|nr:GNAT family N-acetyltransferase [Ornithinimicrobium flavum]